MLLSDTLLKQFPMAWVTLSDDCVIQDHNTEFLSAVGTGDVPLVGRNIVELWQPECRGRFLSDMADILTAKGSVATSNVTLKVLGSPVDLCLTGRVVDLLAADVLILLTADPVMKAASGAVNSLFAESWRYSDTTEMILRRGETYEGSWVLAANRAAEGLFGCSQDGLTGSDVTAVLGAEISPQMRRDVDAAFLAGEIFRATYVDKRSDSQFRMVDWQIIPLDTTDPQHRFWLDRRKVRHNNWDTEMGPTPSGVITEEPGRYTDSDVGIWGWDLVANTARYSERLMTSLGYSPEEVEDPVAIREKVYKPGDLEGLVNHIQRAIEQRKPLSHVVRIKAADGRYHSILFQGQPICDDDGVPVQLIGTEIDITEQIDMGNKLLRVEQIAKVTNWSRRLGEDEMEWSSELRRTSNNPSPSMKNIHKHIHPEDLDLVLNGEARILQKWRLNPDMIDRVRVRVIRPDGSIRYREVSTIVEVDVAGVPFELVGTVQDITDLVEAEQRLLASQKMEIVGQLSGGAAHDFNNLLAVIMGNLELMEDEEDPEERAGFIQSALAATLRGKEMTRSLLSFARQAVLNPRRLNLDEVLVDMQDMMCRLLPDNIKLEIQTKTNLWSVHADQSSFENAVLNLAINARDAMPDGGVITIEIENTVVTKTDTDERQETLEPGPYVVFALSDTGTGISEELMQEVFTPYFTTKPVEHGSGLGLSMVHGFARQSGGGLRLYSKVGVGTTIKLFFQVTEIDASIETDD